MTWSWEWVVEIVERRNGKEIPVGSGALIAPNRILTAAHVVCPLPEGLHVRLEGRQEAIPASIKWLGSDDLDIAVLEANLTHEKLGPVLALLSDREVDAGQTWEAKGYPEVSEKNPRREAYKYGDKTQSWVRSEKFLILKETVDPNSWSGLSGAAIIIGGRVVGVMCSFELDHNNKRLRATPVGAFLDNPDFRKALGLDDEDVQLAKDLETLEVEIAEELRNVSGLCEALAQRLNCKSNARDVAHALVHQTRACDLATHLVDLDLLLSKERHRVQDLLWRLLPLAMDWHAVVMNTRRAVSQGGQAVELPLSTETIAEMVLAGVDGRRCQLVLDEGGPRGAARVPLPPEAYSTLFLHTDGGGDKLVDAVVGHWFAEQEPVIKTFPSRKPPKPDDPKVRVWIRKQFAELSRKNNPNRLPPYVVFSDEEWRDGRGEPMDALWRVACDAFKKEIPSLRLIRLRGGDEEFEQEADVVLQVQNYLGRRG